MKPVYWFGHSTFRLLGKLFFSYRVHQRDRLIEEGPCLIASNHVSFLDPPMVGIAFDKEIYYLARKTLFKKGFFNWLYRSWNSIPVDQEGADFSGLKAIIRKLKEGERVLIFPEGARSWDGKISDAQAGTGLVIEKSGAPVLPVRLFGTWEALPRGSGRLKLSKISVVIGDPVDFSAVREEGLKGRELYQRLSDHTMAAIAALELPEDGSSRSES
ncbi:MAG: lysophospholipid acyltransferase family protein [Verrucomicrobiota bacterium]